MRYSVGEKRAIAGGLSVLALIGGFMIYSAIRLSDTQETAAEQPREPDASSAAAERDRINFIAEVSKRKDLSLDEVNRRIEAYDDAHRAHPLTGEERREREFIKARNRRLDDHMRAEQMRKFYGRQGDDET